MLLNLREVVGLLNFAAPAQRTLFKGQGLVYLISRRRNRLLRFLSSLNELVSVNHFRGIIFYLYLVLPETRLQ